MASTKRAKVEETEENDQVFSEIEKVQEQIDNLSDEAASEIVKIEKEYNKKRRPFYEKRNKVISTIPGFWLRVIMNHEELSDLVTDEDAEVLGHLTDVDIEDSFDVTSGYTIKFTFENNPFFTNKILHKSFKYTEDGFLNVEQSEISWQPGKDVTKREVATSGSNKRTQPETHMSFFTWFDPDEQDLAIGDIFKEELWPNPLKYLYPAVDSDDEMGGEDDLDDEDDDGGD
eukprot:GFYU01016214.1.p1 GENE.GFYU01016214.1~~GFYU01016214.1.p1  ORF type:complete len:230 (-),score=86.83 GFYU01016214.1:126-815(-)